MNLEKLNDSNKKWLFAVGTSALIFAGGFAAALEPTFAPIYPTMVGGLLGALAAFSGAEVSHSWLMGKNVVALGAPEPGPQAPVEPEPEGP